MRRPETRRLVVSLCLLACSAALAGLAGGCRRSGGGSVAARVRLNELMASNQLLGFGVQDDAGDTVYSDWVELHNASSSAVGLAGWSLSDRADSPRKFEFPRGTVIGARGYLLVFFYDHERCQVLAEAAARECRGRARDSAELARCEERLDEETSACRRPAGLVAEFNLSAAAETLFLFGPGGLVADQVGVRAQPAGLSNGIDPETGEYGVEYVPTPRGPNAPVYVKPHGLPDAVPKSVACDAGEMEVEIKVDRDLEAPDELEVTLEHADLIECPSSTAGIQMTQVPVIRVMPAGGDPVRTDASRLDVHGQPRPAEIVTLTYSAFLPRADCGTVRALRITARDRLASRTVAPCVTCCEEQPQVLINEYQPLNSREHGFVFTFVDKDDGTTHVEDPDWIELINHGGKLVDIGHLALVSLRDICELDISPHCLPRYDTWLFGEHGRVPEPLPPGGLLLVLANDDNRLVGERREYTWVRGWVTEPAPDKRYFSTHFELNPNRGPGALPDGFALVDSRTHTILDKVTLDFSGTGGIGQDKSVGRFEPEDYLTRALRPGTITDCPTPEAPNVRACDVPPVFERGVSISSASGARRPAAGEAVTVRTRLNADSDTPLAEIEVALTFQLDRGPDIAAPVELKLTADQSPALPASKLYDFTAVIPGQLAGTFVQFELRARDRRLGLGAVRNQAEEDELSGPRASFVYLVGFTPPAGSPRLSEVLPGNTRTELPPFKGLDPFPTPDFAEVFNPSEAAVDLSGFHLAVAGSATQPLELARGFEFPPGSVLPPRGFLPVFFGPPPPALPPDLPYPYIEVAGLGLDQCRETLHLVAPDAPELGANCVVDTLSWDLSLAQPVDGQSCKVDRAAGRLCEACEGPKCTVELEVPTPGASNRDAGVRDMLFHDAYHQELGPPFPPGVPRGARNACVPPGANVELNAVAFVDEALREAFGLSGRIASAVFVVDRGAGEERIPAAGVSSFPRCAPPVTTTGCTLPPAGYSNMAFRLVLQGPFPSPVVRYRLEATDACGNVFESPWASFGTAAGARPAVVINEVNRAHPVPGDPAPRPWIELFNLSATEVDASGMFLSSETTNPRRAMLPEGSRIPPRGALLVLTNGLARPPHVRADLPWTAETGTLFLIDAEARGTCVLDAVDFDFTGLPLDASLGRHPDGTGALSRLPDASPGSPNSAGGVFLRGDANEDAKVNVSDMVRVLAILFSGEARRPACEDALDADDDGAVSATDAVYIGNALFRHGPAIPPPFPGPGADPTPDALEPGRGGAWVNA
ncbi:MAG: lamin tail domain-containing protein, partial [Planctomycetes bacterium]|nr:lamin tail domain-containing protein [Planctomycetota bacterium]